MTEDIDPQEPLRIISQNDAEEGTFRLDLPFELPILEAFPHHWWQESAIADRRTPLIRWANRQSRINQGRFAQEIPYVAHTFAELLAHLITTPGLEAMVSSSRYSLGLRIGRCFDQQKVAEDVIRHILRAFYPEWTEREIEFAKYEPPAESSDKTEPDLEPLQFSI